MANGKVVISTKLDNSGLEKGIKDITKSTGGLKQALSSIGKAVAVAFSVKAIVDFGNESFKLANTFESSMQQVNRMMGESAASFSDWMETQATAFNMSRRQAAQYGAVFGNLISGFETDSNKIMSETTQLLQASSVIASATGRTMDDVMERIRSGLLGNTEAIEDLGIYANVSMIESTEAFKKFANGKSWEQLDYQTQQQIRLMSILEQTTQRYGTDVMSNTATSISQLAAQWDNLKTSVGQAIQPIARMVIPILSQLILWLDRAAQSVATFLNALFGRSNEKQQNSGMASVVQDAEDASSAFENTSKEAQKLENTLAGFDKLDVLSQPESNTDSAGTATSIPDTTGSGVSQDFTEAPAAVEKFKDALKSLGDYISKTFEPSISQWKGAFLGLQQPIENTMTKIGGAVSNLWTNTLSPFTDYLLNSFVPDIVNTFSQTFAPIFSDVMGFVITQFGLDFEFVCNNISLFVTDILVPAFEQVQTTATDIMDGIKQMWDERGQGIIDGLTKLKDWFRQTWDTIYYNIVQPILNHLFEAIDWLWDKHLRPLWNKLIDFFGALSEYVLAIWNEYLYPLIDKIIKIFGPSVTNVVKTIIDVVGTIVGAVSDVIGGVIQALTGVMDFITGVFTGNWQKAWNGIKNFVLGTWNTIWGGIKGVINLIIDGLNALWRGIYGAFSGIVNGLGDVFGAVGNLFGQNWNFSIPRDPPLIPKLARGAVIPPNREFLAVLGDQKNGRNLEVPESLLRQIYREESNAQDITITFAGDMAQFVRMLKPQINRETKRTGTHLVKGRGDLVFD